MAKLITCEGCGGLSLRTGPVQQYCWQCSDERDLVRKRLWARRHPRTAEQTVCSIERRRGRKERAKEAGSLASRAVARGMHWFDTESPTLLWMARVEVPFSYAASKNHIYTMRRFGHLALRREARHIRTAISMSLQRELQSVHVAHNKVWIEILVQKPNHKGDAVNVVDLVCDAVKDAIGVDDRWFAIRRLDWEIVKENPKLFVGVGQESDQDCQICSYCGGIKPLSEFNSSRYAALGVGRECRECRRVGRRLAKEQAGCVPPQAAPQTATSTGEPVTGGE